MSCCTETEKNYAAPVLAGNFRLLLGLLMAFAGLYIGTLSGIQGHGLGLLMALGSPFVIFKDDK
jgi:hypothetical protein